MNEQEIKEMREKVRMGILLARKRLLEKTIRENGSLVVMRDGEVVRIGVEEMKRLLAEWPAE